MYVSPTTVLSDSFETLQVFRSWSEDVHIVEDITSQIIFCHFFYKTNLCHFCTADNLSNAKPSVQQKHPGD